MFLTYKKMKETLITIYFLVFFRKNTDFGFFVFNGISTLFRLFNAKAILLEEQ